MTRALKKMPPPLEHAEQVALFQWAAVNVSRMPGLDMLYAVPNGGFRMRMTAGKMKAEGAKAGVPDVCLPVPVGRYSGLYVELKRQGLSKRALGSRSDEQVSWQKRLIGQGYAVATCYGWEYAANAIRAYYAETFAMPPGGDCAFWGV